MLPPPRQRTVAVDTSHFLTVADGELMSLTEARQRAGDQPWPETELQCVRYFAGSVRVADTRELLSLTEPRGYAVVIVGDLVVDGMLNATAGGDGFDSLLLVTGDVWATSACFFNCITLVCKTLEVASVILCAFGDNGGALWADTIRAQVFHYATYFAKPDCPIDALCVGDVYGERSFPPERSAEVFVGDVLVGGRLNERLATAQLEHGQAIVRQQ